jgi:hypothetical protein
MDMSSVESFRRIISSFLRALVEADAKICSRFGLELLGRNFHSLGTVENDIEHEESAHLLPTARDQGNGMRAFQATLFNIICHPLKLDFSEGYKVYPSGGSVVRQKSIELYVVLSF